MSIAVALIVDMHEESAGYRKRPQASIDSLRSFVLSSFGDRVNSYDTAVRDFAERDGTSGLKRFASCVACSSVPLLLLLCSTVVFRTLALCTFSVCIVPTSSRKYPPSCVHGMMPSSFLVMHVSTESAELISFTTYL